MIRGPLLALLLAASSAPARPSPEWRLTADGLGPVRIGMTQKQVTQMLKDKLRGEAIDDENLCVEKEASSLPGVTFMFEGGQLSRVSVGKPSPIKTQKSIGVGAAAAEVRRAYGARLVAGNNYYEDPPAEYLTYWTVPEKRGLRFETSTDRKVYAIHAGTQSITYVEGCA